MSLLLADGVEAQQIWCKYSALECTHHARARWKCRILVEQALAGLTGRRAAAVPVQ